MLEREDITVSIEKRERIEGITWMEIAEQFCDALKGLGYNPEELKNFLEELK